MLCTSETIDVLRADQTQEASAYPPYLVYVIHSYDAVRHEAARPYKPDGPTPVLRPVMNFSAAITSHASFADLRDKIRDFLQSGSDATSRDMYGTDASEHVPLDNSFVYYTTLIFSLAARESEPVEIMRHTVVPAIPNAGVPTTADAIREWCDRLPLESVDARVAERGLRPVM